MTRALALALCVVPIACTASDDATSEAWTWRLPDHLPPPFVPASDPMTLAKVELGRHLFYEERLSLGATVSCATCHDPSLAFTDGEATSVGADGHSGTRSAMSLANVAWMPTLTWGNPVLETLEAQALVPLFLDIPLEMGSQYVIDETLEALARDDAWIERFEAAFPEAEDPFTIASVASGLAAFQRSLVSADSAYDRWLAGDASALSPSALRGLELFESPRLQCAGCHASVLQSGDLRTEIDPDATSRFENTGLYALGDGRGYPQPNTGLYEFTHDPADIGRHRVPSLRNVAVTAPYMHDGSIPDLDGVIDHYAAGSRTGSGNPNKSPRVAGFSITASERADLLAFLHALTDEAFLSDPRHADPGA